MTHAALTTGPAAPAGSTADDRATTFQPVGPEGAQHYSGEGLLVSAYAVLWVVLLVWVAFLWRRQRSLDDRLAELEAVLGKAAHGAGADPPKS